MASRMLSMAVISLLASSCATTPGEIYVAEKSSAKKVNTTDFRGESISESAVNAAVVGETYSLADDEVYIRSENIAAINGSGEFRNGAGLEDDLHQCKGLLRHDGQEYLSSFEGSTRLIQSNGIFPRDLLD